jgi:hypothetical protein
MLRLLKCHLLPQAVLFEGLLLFCYLFLLLLLLLQLSTRRTLRLHPSRSLRLHSLVPCRIKVSHKMVKVLRDLRHHKLGRQEHTPALYGVHRCRLGVVVSTPLPVFFPFILGFAFVLNNRDLVRHSRKVGCKDCCRLRPQNVSTSTGYRSRSSVWQGSRVRLKDICRLGPRTF